MILICGIAAPRSPEGRSDDRGFDDALWWRKWVWLRWLSGKWRIFWGASQWPNLRGPRLGDRHRHSLPKSSRRIRLARSWHWGCCGTYPGWVDAVVGANPNCIGKIEWCVFGVCGCCDRGGRFGAPVTDRLGIPLTHRRKHRQFVSCASSRTNLGCWLAQALEHLVIQWAAVGRGAACHILYYVINVNLLFYGGNFLSYSGMCPRSPWRGCPRSILLYRRLVQVDRAGQPPSPIARIGHK